MSIKSSLQELSLHGKVFLSLGGEHCGLHETHTRDQLGPCMCRDAEIEKGMQASQHAMNWVSHQLMRDRVTDGFPNPGARMHSDAIITQAEREKKASSAHPHSPLRL